MKRFRRIAAGAAALAVLGLLVAASGVIPVTESPGDYALTRWFMQFSKRRSITTHSVGVEPPALDSPVLVVRGAGHYETTCRTCHGAPPGLRARIALGLDPPPPNLSARAPTWSDGELFSIVKHGIAFTGMPAWPEPQRDDEVWAMVAFLRRLPALGPAEYNRLAGLDIAAPAGSAQACARCHGANGEGRGEGAFPRLAGQSETYLRLALEAYSRGGRRSGMMRSVVVGLAPEEIDAVSTYYASLELPTPQPALTAARDEPGARIAQRGIPEQNVPSCADCHGPGGRPRNPAYPRLAGQHEEYLVLQLQLFASDRRGGSRYAHIMQQVAPRLKPEQMREVARYYANASP